MRPGPAPLLPRAQRPPPADQRRMAWFSRPTTVLQTRWARGRPCGAPLRSTPFSNDEFRVATQPRFGVPLTCLKPLSINHPSLVLLRPIRSSTPSTATSKTCGGGGWRHDGKAQFVVSVISAWFRRALIPHWGGCERNPEDFQGHVLRVHPGAPDLDLPKEDIRVLNKAIPDFLLDLHHPRLPLGPASFPASSSTCRGRARLLRT